MSGDEREPEIVALDAVQKALEPLEYPERKRVIDWANARYGTFGELTQSVQKMWSDALTAIHVYSQVTPDPTPEQAKLFKHLDGTKFARKAASS
ncbi:hypothetical protein [uncultured Jatrophihabitans sp.]|uniref:hypothetical protein n=1 Tax=uncultured Jatrophihabitans sp. TaxID=1610747 RepID=UPI0035CBFEE9